MAGLYWEKYCHDILKKAGFTKVPGWECLFQHHEQKLFLSVYVDDFKMAGHAQNLTKMWQTLSRNLELEPPSPLHGSVYLGCGQYDATFPTSYYDIREDFYSLVIDAKDQHKDSSSVCAGGDSKHAGGDSKHSPKKATSVTPTSSWQYEMFGHAEQCVQRYTDLAPKISS